jgi:hypothetical protein
VQKLGRYIGAGSPADRAVLSVGDGVVHARLFACNVNSMFHAETRRLEAGF